MFLRKRKLPDVKKVPSRKKTKLVKPDLLQKSWMPLLHGFVNHLSLSDFISLSATNKGFHLFSKNEIEWRNLYYTQFGPLYFQTGYKNQYIAEQLRLKSHNENLPDMQKLMNHLANLPFHPWMNFYFAHLAEAGLIAHNTPKKYGFAALLIKQSFQRESNPFLQCALTLVFAMQDKKIKAIGKFAYAMLLDPTIFNQYLSAGKNFKLCSLSLANLC